MNGVFTTLYAFGSFDKAGSNADGRGPSACLLFGSDGNLYGTTQLGGTKGYGTIFKLTMVPVISSFVRSIRPNGTSVALKGANFTGVTAVKIGTVPVHFMIHSDSSLTLVVPPSARSDRIIVVNRFGTGASDSVLEVTPKRHPTYTLLDRTRK